jgi:hypothetical protein
MERCRLGMRGVWLRAVLGRVWHHGAATQDAKVVLN